MPLHRNYVSLQAIEHHVENLLTDGPFQVYVDIGGDLLVGDELCFWVKTGLESNHAVFVSQRQGKVRIIFSHSNYSHAITTEEYSKLETFDPGQVEVVAKRIVYLLKSHTTLKNIENAVKEKFKGFSKKVNITRVRYVNKDALCVSVKKVGPLNVYKSVYVYLDDCSNDMILLWSRNNPSDGPITKSEIDNLELSQSIDTIVKRIVILGKLHWTSFPDK